MTHIIISVNFKFSIRKFPLKIFEIFLVVAEVSALAAKGVAQALLAKIQSDVMMSYAQKGFRKLGSTRRILRGILGKIEFPLARVRKGNGKILRPLLDRIDFPAYRRITEDSYETCLGLLPHLSYRRSVNESERINANNGPSKSSLHRHLKRIANQLRVHPVQDAKGYSTLLVDGTGARIQEWTCNFLQRKCTTRKGEIRVVYAAKRREGPYRVIGRWTESNTWQSIAEETYKRISPVDMKVLVSDGGPGIEEAFKLDHMEHQRCSVHAWRELKIFLYFDGLKKAQQEKYLEMMKAVPVFDYAKHKILESLRPKDKQEVKEVISNSKEQLKELSSILKKKGYQKAATYVERLIDPLMIFLESWTATGDWSLPTNNIPENRFSLFKNRIARIGKRWSEDGLLRFFDLTVHKIFPGYDWDMLMDRLLPKSGNISGEVLSIEYT